MMLNIVNAQRFLKAQKWDMDRAEETWRGAVQWRKDFDMTGKRRHMDEMDASPGTDPVHDWVRSRESQWLGHDDKHGIPVIFDRCGSGDPGGIVRELGGDLDIFLQYAIEKVEKTLEVAIEKDCLDFGYVKVYDVAPVAESPHYYNRGWNSIAGFKKFAHIADSFYPERYRRILVLGTTMVSNLVWRACQPLVPEQSKRKIALFSTQAQWIPVVEEEIPLEQFHSYLGGTGSDDGVLFGGYVEPGEFERFQKKHIEASPSAQHDE
mmetsp:Transcript_24521/g.57929  ORF Transcript_24521/g.57929 Transcript_24521/m.57929 type:complete len:265 (-) Transcript_24521:51-845(-)